MQLSAGTLAYIQDDGCFALVCGDSSLCLCLTECQQVSYSKIWQESAAECDYIFYSLRYWPSLHSVSAVSVWLPILYVNEQDAVLSVLYLTNCIDRWKYIGITAVLVTNSLLSLQSS